MFSDTNCDFLNSNNYFEKHSQLLMRVAPKDGNAGYVNR